MVRQLSCEGVGEMRRVLKWLLLREFKRHKGQWHDGRDCIFCFIDPPYQKKFLDFIENA